MSKLLESPQSMERLIFATVGKLVSHHVCLAVHCPIRHPPPLHHFIQTTYTHVHDSKEPPACVASSMNHCELTPPPPPLTVGAAGDFLQPDLLNVIHLICVLSPSPSPQRAYSFGGFDLTKAASCVVVNAGSEANVSSGSL